MVNGKNHMVKVNQNGEKYFVNEDGTLQIIKPVEDFLVPVDGNDQHDGEVNVACSICKSKLRDAVEKIKSRREFFEDEKGEKYILDKDGIKRFIQYN